MGCGVRVFRFLQCKDHVTVPEMTQFIIKNFESSLCLVDMHSPMSKQKTIYRLFRIGPKAHSQAQCRPSPLTTVNNLPPGPRLQNLGIPRPEGTDYATPAAESRDRIPFDTAPDPSSGPSFLGAL